MGIEEWAEKGFRIGIFPVLHLGKHEWTAGVRIGKEDKMTWLSKKMKDVRLVVSPLIVEH